MNIEQASALSPEELRIKAAELDGYKSFEYYPHGILVERGKCVKFRKGEDVFGVLAEDLPDYVNDLNAMHEAEDSHIYEVEDLELREDRIETFYNTLKRLVCGAVTFTGPCWDDNLTAHATARQRAIAFVVAMTEAAQ